MTTADDAPAAGPWPGIPSPPSNDASNREWAAYYRDALGWIVLPMPSDADTISYAMSLTRAAVAEYITDHKGEEPDEEIRLAYWDDSREIAEAARKGPIGYIEQQIRGKVEVASDVTDAMLDLWFVSPPNATGPRRKAHERPICIRPGRSAKGFPVVLIDVDPRHGGDIEREWGQGPQASTPGGGRHTFVLSTGKERNSVGALAPGVDVVAATPIAVPSGAVATPGRTWTRWEAPGPAPDGARRASPGKRKAALPAGQGPTEREPGDDEDELLDGEPGRAARLVAEPVDDGERNAAAAAIVGMLARPGACPDDFVCACLDLLVEHRAGLDRPSDAVREEAARWRHALTRGPRDADFAAEVLRAWYETRNVARSKWKATPERFARSVWRTCEMHLGSEAGAEDLGVGPALGALPQWWPKPAPPAADPPLEPRPPLTPREEFILNGPTAPPASAGTGAQAATVQGPRWRGGIDPGTFVRSLGEFYTDEALEKDLRREPIQIAEVMPAWDFIAGGWLTKDITREGSPPLAHGWGEHLGRALGGMAPGDFRVIGAGGAGAGKTWFECWLAHGLALATAARIAGVPGFASAPVVLPVWLTEMPKMGEIYWRLVGAHLGFDVACISWGRQAHEAGGVRAMAEKYSMTPHEVVSHARGLERLHGNDDRFPLCIARRHVIKVLSMSDLPRRERKAGIVIDHRAGPVLVDHLADAVHAGRHALADLAGVSESDVLPLVLIDPGQRFAGEGESEKRAIDALFSAVVQVLCGEVGCAVIGTSDTTKQAAREVNEETFLSKDAPALAADIFAGSQAIMHNADVLAVCGARPVAGSLSTTQWVRVLKNRAGAPAVAFPFAWEMHLGRFKAGDPEPLRKPPEATPGGGNRRDRERGETPSYSGPAFGSVPRGWRTSAQPD